MVFPFIGSYPCDDCPDFDTQSPDDRNTVAVALMDKQIPEVGTDVDWTGQCPLVPVGPALLGRVVDPLGRPVADLDPQKGVALDQASIAGSLPTLSRISPGKRHEEGGEGLCGLCGANESSFLLIMK